MSIVLLFIGLFLLSACLTGLFRVYALKKELMDHPNHRSSHAEPTPRGGGIIFAALFLLALFIANRINLIPNELFKAVALPALIITLLGYADDIIGLSVTFRLIVQASAAIIFLYLIRHLVPIWLRPFEIPCSLIMMLAIVWSTNLYNFMDGIDGLSSVEAITVYGVGGILLWSQGGYPLALLMGIIVASVSGFLVWNWPRARIFMGDSGSLFLGFLIIPVALISYFQYEVSFFIWIILYLFSLMDATLTLLRRVLHGDKWYEAHRLHAFQRLHRSGYSHAQILYIMIGLNTVFSLLAFLMAYSLMGTFMGLFIAVLIYVIFYAIVEYRFPMYTKKRHD